MSKRILTSLSTAFVIAATLSPASTAFAQSSLPACYRECDGDQQCIRSCSSFRQEGRSRPNRVIPQIPPPADKPVAKWIDNAFHSSGDGGGGGGGGR